MTTDPAPSNRVEFAGRELILERPSGRKTSRALALLRALSHAAPGLSDKIAEFRRGYERANVIELDRAQALLRFPPQPLFDDQTGEPLLDAAGKVRMVDSPLATMTEEDWQRSDHRLKLPKSPSGEEVTVAVFDYALEVAEEHVYALLALFTIRNGDVKAAHKSSPEALSELIDRTVDELLDDGFGDEWLPLAVAVSELVDEHFVQKAKRLGSRMGNVLRLFGMNPTSPSPSPSPEDSSSDGPTSSTPPSSSPTPDDSDTDPTTSSTSDGPSSSSSDTSPTRPTNGNGSNEPSRNLEEPATA